MVAINTRLVNTRELRRQYELEPDRCIRQLTESLEAGSLRPENFSIRGLYEAICGEEALRALNPFAKSGNVRLLEAANAIDTGAFSNITGQIVYNKIKQAYESPKFLWPKLVQTIQTTFLNGERIPGVSQIGDKAEIVAEGMPYPRIGLSEEYIDTVPLKKRGFILPVTREIVIADRTALVLKNAGEGGEFLGVNKERRCIDLATGTTNNYKRNGTATNTYLGSGAYINTTANPFTSGVEWKAIQTALLLFDALTDPRTDSSNPVAGMSLEILTSQYVKFQTSSASTWWIGDPKSAFAYMEAWAIEPQTAAPGNQLEFEQDIVNQFKVSEMGAAQVIDPRYMVQNTAS